VISRYLRTHGVLSKINEQVRFARKRFGRVRGDRFSGGARRATKSSENARWKSSTSGSNRLPSRSWPGRERERFPSRSALSRFLAALTEAPVEALRTLLTSRSARDRPLAPASTEKQTGGLVDRAGNTWVVFDLDGTREAASPRALPQSEDLPPP